MAWADRINFDRGHVFLIDCHTTRVLQILHALRNQKMLYALRSQKILYAWEVRKFYMPWKIRKFYIIPEKSDNFILFLRSQKILHYS